MKIRTPVVLGLVTWAIISTAAALILVMQGRPDPEQAAPQRRERVRRPMREVDRDAVMLAEALKIAVEPTAPPRPGEEPREVGQRISNLLDELHALGNSEDWSQKKEEEIWRKLYPLLANEPKAHLALMNRLRMAETEDEVHSILELLVWSPFTKMSRHGDITREIEAAAREILAKDPNAARRYGAARVLCRYDQPDREAFLFGVERLGQEPDAKVRDTLLDELTVAGKWGRGMRLSKKEAEPLIDGLRQRFHDGELWCGTALSRWSSDPADFDLIKGRLAVETSPYARQDLLNAFQGDVPMTRGREAECRELLMEVLQSPSEDSGVRVLAANFLASFGPLDETCAEAIRKYDEERKRR